MGNIYLLDEAEKGGKSLAKKCTIINLGKEIPV